MDALVKALYHAHFHAARANASLSTSAFVAVQEATGDPVRGVIAGLSGFGQGIHGPLTEARRQIFLEDAPARRVRILRGEKIAGFGNSFFKDKVDPSFQPVVDLLRDQSQYAQILAVQHELSEIKNLTLFPNAAALSAAVAELVGLPLGREAQLVLPARVAGWLSL